MNSPSIKSEQLKTSKIISYISLFYMGTFCFLYSIFLGQFAESHIQLSFLDFPIFIGEIIMMVCMVLLGFLWRTKSIKITKWHYLMFFYIAWILIKAFHGYFSLGPLSFRNAALFYYPIFTLFGFYFFSCSKDFINQNIIISLIVVMGTALLTELVNMYYLLTYMLLFIVLVMKVEKKRMKNIGIIIAVFIFIIRYVDFFQGSRTHLIGLTMSFLFLMIYFFHFFSFKNFKKQHRTIVFIVVLGFFAINILKIHDHNSLKSLLSPVEIVRGFKFYNSRLEEKNKKFVPLDLEVKLYNDDKQKLKKMRRLREWQLSKQLESLYKKDRFKGKLNKKDKEKVVKGAIVEYIDTYKDAIVKHSRDILQKHAEEVLITVVEMLEKEDKIDFSKLKEITKEKVSHLFEEFKDDIAETNKYIMKKSQELIVRSGMIPAPPKVRKLNVAAANIQFRLLIWRDMAREMWEDKGALFYGFNFGRPQRSRSLEVLQWAKEEWERDGWITPHNSFLHMFYRAGIVGILCVISVMGVLIKMTKDFFKIRSIEGGLLIGILVYWLTISNFLVILELPYNAIPFWSLFGMTLAYCRGSRRSRKYGHAQRQGQGAY